MRTGTITTLAAVAVLCLAGAADAQPTYTYAWYDSTGTTEITNRTLTVAPGSTYTARLYLVQTSGLELTIRGVGSAEARVTYDDPAGVARIQSAGDVTRNPSQWTDLAFGGPVQTFRNDGGGVYTNTGGDYSTATEVRWVQTVTLDGQGNYNQITATNNRVLLSDVTFKGLTTGSALITALQFPEAGTENFAYGDTENGFETFDNRFQNNTSSFTLSFQPVPEPAAVLVVGAIGLAVATARRRWRAKSAVTS